MKSDPSVLVVLPSRLKANREGKLFLDGAVKSIRQQTIHTRARIKIAAGIDAASSPPTGDDWNQIAFRFGKANQAAALNAACTISDEDFVAFLEDDDEWAPNFLETALHVLERVDFVSSTQLEVNENGIIAAINDFPTPSGWVMKKHVWENVGTFNEQYRWHLDSEWLGRLARKGHARAHLVEATAPIDANNIARRPWLQNVILHGGPNVCLFRHSNLLPLVKRTIHEGSGVAKIASDAMTGSESLKERELLTEIFGELPW